MITAASVNSRILSGLFVLLLFLSPLPKLFTLCRQFNTEYEERLKFGWTAKFKDLSRERYTQYIRASLKSITPRLDRVTKAEIQLLAFCQNYDCTTDRCGTCSDLSKHIDWIKDVVPAVSKLKELDVKIYKCQPGCITDTSSHNPRLDRTLDKLTGLPLTSRIEVFPFYVLQESGGLVDYVKAYEVNAAPEMVWTKDFGWEDV